MGKPAARIGDMHICPMSDGPKPHVGGPVIGPGTPTVLIGGVPAVTLGDMCTCVGPPDVIAMGSTGVLIGGKPAARMGDMTAHGGSITLGCFTVLIGESSGGGGGAGAGGAGGLGKTSAAQSKDNQNSKALKDAAKNGDEKAIKTNKEDFKAQFSLVDEAGKGKKNVKYEIKTSDGQVHDGKTDSEGKTQNLSGYTTADCKVTFYN